MSLQNGKQICCPYCYYKLIETKSDKLLTGGRHGFFVNSCSLGRHINKFHTNICKENYFPCPYSIDCGLSFCSIEQMNRHVMMNHFCTNSFPKIGSFCSHIKELNQILDIKVTQKKQEFLIIPHICMNLKT